MLFLFVQKVLFSGILYLFFNLKRALIVDVLTEGKENCKSWFQQIRDISIKYLLPHPLIILESPPTKLAFKKLCKLKVTQYWRKLFQNEASQLKSLKYFKPEFISLNSPHPIFTTLNGNPYETKKAKLQSRFLSGRYRTEKLCRFWSSNKAGICLLEACKDKYVLEDLDHILYYCSGLSETRKRLITFTNKYTDDKPEIKTITDKYLNEDGHLFCQFMVDCSVLGPVISSYQLYGRSVLDHLFYITRTWCHSLHSDRLRQLGRDNFG